MMEQMTITTTGRDGSLTRYRITNAAEIIDQIPCRYNKFVDGNDVTGSGSNADIARLYAWVGSMNTPEPPVKPQQAGTSSRVIVPVDKYQIGDMIGGHEITGFGRDWAPNADQYSANGIDPSVSRVCYAYLK